MQFDDKLRFIIKELGFRDHHEFDLPVYKNGKISIIRMGWDGNYWILIEVDENCVYEGNWKDYVPKECKIKLLKKIDEFTEIAHKHKCKCDAHRRQFELNVYEKLNGLCE